MSRLTLVFLSLFLGLGLAFSQTKVNGVILSADDGSPIFGATVIVKGKTTTGTTSDLDGKFTLNVAANTTLVVSFIGYETKEVVGKANMKVLLKESSKALQEVMVTAIGVKRSEKSLAYGAAQVKGESLTQAGDRSALNALQGKVAGLTIGQSSGAAGASTRVFIRGFSSLTGSNQPLFVIDGVPVSNGGSISTSLEGNNDFGNRMNDINPNDIESMSVLKGASASALYGARAANGVIMITTKKGKAADKVKIDFTNNTTFSNVTMLPVFQNRYGQGWNAAYDLHENGSWGPLLDGKVRPWGYELDNSQLIKPFAAQNDNMKDFYDMGVTIDNSIAISGGKDRTTFYMSYSNVHDNGVIPSNVDTYNRNALSLKGSYDGNWLVANASFNYIKKNTSVASSGQGYSVFNNLLQVPRDFSFVDMKDYKNKFYSTDNWYTPYGVINPYYSINEDGNKYNEDRAYGSMDLTANLPANIKLTWRGGGDISNGRTKTYRSIMKPQGANSDATVEIGSVSEGSSQTMELNSDIYASWNGNLTDKLTLGLLVGQNTNMRQSKGLSSNISGLDLEGFYELTNSSNPASTSSSFSERRLIGIYGQVDLAYREYLFLNMGVRNDWSSTLPIENNSFAYPTVGLSFLFSDAFPSIKSIIPYGKVRASYGMTGNDTSPYLIYSGLYQANQTIAFGNGLNFPFNGVNGFTYGNRIGNPNLKAELSKEWEIGTDLRFLKNRLGVEASYYNKQTVNQIMPVTISPASGLTSQLMNLGSVRNQGIEVLLNVIPIKTRDWNWDLTLNYTVNRSKVEELGNGLEEVSIQGFASGQALIALPGYPLGMFVGYSGMKDPQGNPVVDEKSGQTKQSTTREIFGSSEAKFQAGLMSALSYKNITFGFAIDAKIGGLMYSRTRGTLGFVGNSFETLYNDRQPFIVPNSVYLDKTGAYAENTTPISQEGIAAYWNNNGTEWDRGDLIDKSYIKLRDLYITYSLPKTWINKSPISGLSVSLVGKNLLTWRAKDNRFVDPTVSTFGTDLESEFGEFSAAPSIRSLGFSIKVSL